MKVMSPEWCEQKERQIKRKKLMRRLRNIINFIETFLLYTALGFVTGFAVIVAIRLIDLYVEIGISDSMYSLLIVLSVMYGVINGVRYARLYWNSD